MNGYISPLSEAGIPAENLNGILDSFNANLYAFGNLLWLGAMYGILLGSCAVLLAVYAVIVILKAKKLGR